MSRYQRQCPLNPFCFHIIFFLWSIVCMGWIVFCFLSRIFWNLIDDWFLIICSVYTHIYPIMKITSEQNLKAQGAWSNFVQTVRSMQTRIGFKTWCNNCENKTMFWAQSGLYFNLISSFQSSKDYKSVLFSPPSKLKRKGKGPMKQFELT